MGQRTAIEWCDATWNPVTGCSPVSAACDNCYARRLAVRFPAIYPRGFAVHERPERLLHPLRWKQPLQIFVCSMGDLMHEAVSSQFIGRVIKTIERTAHTYLVLTKRPARFHEFDWPDNVRLGVTVEDRAAFPRIATLVRMRRAGSFISCEPLLEELTGDGFDLHGIEWLIIGGERGPRPRFTDPRWVSLLREKCLAQQVEVFFQRWGNNRETLRLVAALDPVHRRRLEEREFPVGMK